MEVVSSRRLLGAPVSKGSSSPTRRCRRRRESGRRVVDRRNDQRCELWRLCKDRLFTARDRSPIAAAAGVCQDGRLPCEILAGHLFDYTPGWTRTIEYTGDDPRLPDAIRTFNREKDVAATITTPLALGGRTLGWMTLASPRSLEPEGTGGASSSSKPSPPGGAGAAHSRVVERSRSDERRKAFSRNAPPRATSTTTWRRASAAILMTASGGAA